MRSVYNFFVRKIMHPRYHLTKHTSIPFFHHGQDQLCLRSHFLAFLCLTLKNDHVLFLNFFSVGRRIRFSKLLVSELFQFVYTANLSGLSHVDFHKFVILIVQRRPQKIPSGIHAFRSLFGSWPCPTASSDVVKGTGTLYIGNGCARLVFGQSYTGMAISKSDAVGKIGFDIAIMECITGFSELSANSDQIGTAVQARSVRKGSPHGISPHTSICTKYSIINIRNIDVLFFIAFLCRLAAATAIG
mmetsp:Transcript_15447/g.38923  ORF Transcript_15447/g.38923 Transcript_15447/m.38923 type:complete len:245 (+) Transcript_15447:131-865(+)